MSGLAAISPLSVRGSVEPTFSDVLNTAIAASKSGGTDGDSGGNSINATAERLNKGRDSASVAILGVTALNAGVESGKTLLKN
jgi:hypothetical protein